MDNNALPPGWVRLNGGGARKRFRSLVMVDLCAHTTPNMWVVVAPGDCLWVDSIAARGAYATMEAAIAAAEVIYG